MKWVKSTFCEANTCVELAFTKSSFSGSQGGNCVEVAYAKSSFSGNNGSCVEHHLHEGQVHIRDSKNPDAGFLTFTPDSWAGFVAGVKDGEFDL